ncbi:MAG: hypothetical protein LUE29_00950 [Lachnospiraceae bacterium]|nr:hypothetical protein [Lachnospiraceae bacterium]
MRDKYDIESLHPRKNSYIKRKKNEITGNWDPASQPVSTTVPDVSMKKTFEEKQT